MTHRMFRLRQFTYGALQGMSKVLIVSFLILSTGFAPANAQSNTKILALGDSLTQGYGLAQHLGLVPQLENWLQDQGRDVAVLNGGVSGDTSAGGLDRVEWLLVNDVDGVMVALGGNDVLRGLPPQVTKDNLRGILEILQKRDLPVILVGMRAPGNYGPDYKAEFDSIFPELAAEYGAIYVPSFFEPFINNGENLQSAQEFFQNDGIHPNRQGVEKIVRYLGPYLIKLLEQ